MTDAAIIFFACFSASLATSVFWRLYTQLPRQERRSKLANRENLSVHSSAISNMGQQNHGA